MNVVMACGGPQLESLYERKCQAELNGVPLTEWTLTKKEVAELVEEIFPDFTEQEKQEAMIGSIELLGLPVKVAA